MGFMKEFRDFAMRGNVVDLAVAVVIGGAFGKIVSSLVGDIVMPVVGLLLGGVNFSGLAIQVGDAVIKYGAFIQVVVDFVIIAFVIFLAVKALTAMKKKEPAPAAPSPLPSKEEELLTQIRDLLKHGR
jgi:large conductance mechanosensitive channel